MSFMFHLRFSLGWDQNGSDAITTSAPAMEKILSDETLVESRGSIHDLGILGSHLFLEGLPCLDHA
jgi:hypothetical protein